ncbi:cystatin-C, partial [Sigmodon hispidus]
MLEEGAKEALDYAVKKHSESNYNLYLSSVVDVLKVRKQVVSGKIFFFDVILGQSTCLKTQVDLTKCSLNDKAGVKE